MTDPKTTATPAQELRAAASKIRDAKHWATPAPWVAYTDEVCTDWHPDSAEYKELGRDIDVARDTGPGNVAHIALWHPGIAELVAEWLDAVAVMWDGLVNDANRWMFLGEEGRKSLRSGPWDAEHALKLARAINGEVTA